MTVSDQTLATLLHAIWMQGPLTMEQIMDLTPEVTLLERAFQSSAAP
ncbi:hypothetical protein [Deinococcus hopiensis]|nr:hypothetical protein [Deinococcus hopiensis]